MKQSILKGWTFVVGLAFLASIPLERIPSINIHGSNLRISQVLLAALVISLLFQRFKERNFKLIISPAIRLYLLFIVGMLGSFISMHDLSRGIQVFCFITFTSLVLWVLPNIIHDRSTLEKSLNVIIISSVVISLFGIYQFLGDTYGLPTYLTGLRTGYTKIVFGFARIQATELEPLYLANFLIIPITILFTQFVRGAGSYSKKYLLFALSLLGVVFMLTLARGAYIGLIISLIIVAIYSYKQFFKTRPITTLIGMGVIVLAVVSFLIYLNHPSAHYVNETVRHFLFLKDDFSAQERVSRFSSGLSAFKSSPIFGVGVGNFGPWLAGYPHAVPQLGWSIVNNEPLEILSETGIVGFMLAMIGLVALITRSIKAIYVAKDDYYKGVMIALFAAVIGVLVQYQTFSTLYIMQIWVLFGLNFTVQNIIFRQDSKSKTPVTS